MSDNATYTDDIGGIDDTKRITFSVVFGCILLVGVTGNVSVIGLIVLVRKLHSTVNLCLACLAVADLVILVFLPIIPVNILYDLDDSYLGLNLCIFMNSMSRGALVCSTLIFVLVGVERYTVLCYPLKSLGWWTRKKVCLLLAVISLITVSVSIPYGIATTYEEVIFEDNSTKIICDMDVDHPWLDRYDTFVNCVFFLVPIPLLFLLYGKMIIGLKTKVPQNDSQGIGARGASKSRSKVVKMLLVVVSVFVICLLPFKIYTLVDIYAPNVIDSLDDRSIFIINWSARIVLYINHASNPVVYFLMSDNFREAFKTVFCMRYKTVKPPKKLHTVSSSL